MKTHYLAKRRGTKGNTHIKDSQWVKTNVNIVLERKHLVASGTDTMLHRLASPRYLTSLNNSQTVNMLRLVHIQSIYFSFICKPCAAFMIER